VFPPPFSGTSPSQEQSAKAIKKLRRVSLSPFTQCAEHGFKLWH
jgi:hypothetical protein